LLFGGRLKNKKMSATINKLFVYGSLRSGFKNPAYAYLTAYFEYSGEAKTKGVFYEKQNVPVAVATTENNFIIGEVYTLKNEDEFSWAFEQLDDYEGLHVLPNEQPLYERKIIEIIQNGVAENAWVYWYNGNIDGLPKIETEDLLEYLTAKNKG
jgi:gamma-glutamylcyclotransferase (GGCT)/AIG2-like uncharacterized protein YtfP